MKPEARKVIAATRGAAALAAVVVVAMLGVDRAGAHQDPAERAEELRIRSVAQPERADLAIERARQLRYAGDPHAALAELDRARAIDPTVRDIHYERAALLLILGDADASLTEIDRYLDGGLPSARALDFRASLHAREGRVDRAIADYRAALALRYDVATCRALGLLLEKHARLDEAAAHYREGLERLPHAHPIARGLVRVEVARHRYADALAAVDTEIAATGRESSSWLLLRGDVLDAAGDSDEARKARIRARDAARAALGIRPTAINHVMLGRAELALGDVEAADREARVALQSAPPFEAARTLAADVAAVKQR